ncbi:MAG: beta-N-acetylhexosaminidase [Tannerellaceae bacterium]
MLKRIIQVFFCGLILCGMTVYAQSVSIIPMPAKVTAGLSTNKLHEKLITYTDDVLRNEAEQLNQDMGSRFKVVKGKKASKGIFLKLESGTTLTEGYKLNVDEKLITICGADEAGVFYGTQSLLQQINSTPDGILTCVEIEDVPRYNWRGYMLDESRHFFGKEKVKQLLDMMSYYKLNKFHWHLTDEPAWRIEIKKYPKLTEIGAEGSWSDPDLAAQSYTQDDIREIVAYAADRHIEVIPEIDMPGHATAANRAYPQFSGGGTPDHPDFTFNPGKEEVYAYLTDILREVAELFPSKYMHIGGDEVSFGIKAWESDPDVQALLKREGLKHVKDAERYFINRMTDSVQVLGKELLGWDELLEIDADPTSTTIMWWRHDRVNQLKKSLENRYQTILCPRRPLYFDFIQNKDDKWGRVWNGFCPLEDVYAFPDKGMEDWNLSETESSFIKGIQANVWTERIQNADRLDYMTFPRICALAESAWSMPNRKDYACFEGRLNQAYLLFAKEGICYYDHRDPSKTPEPIGCVKKDKKIDLDFRD